MINEELKRFDIFSICNSKHGIYIKTSRMLEKDEIEELTNIIISKGNKSVTIEDYSVELKEGELWRKFSIHSIVQGVVYHHKKGGFSEEEKNEITEKLKELCCLNISTFIEKDCPRIIEYPITCRRKPNS